MTFSRLSQRTNQWMRAVNTWLSEEELEQIKKVKGDVSVSLWIRRQVRNALSEGDNRLPADSPKAASVPNATTTPQGINSEEVEAV
jgi:hypothetical protein